jgi:hypothetical protein
MTPSRNGADQQQDQDDKQNGAQAHNALLDLDGVTPIDRLAALRAQRVRKA